MVLLNCRVSHVLVVSYYFIIGIKQLRVAIAEFHKRVDGIPHISADDVVVGPGTKQLSFLLEEVFNGGKITIFVNSMFKEQARV